MSPIDDELRTTLRTRAGEVRPGADPLAGIERRARRMRRRRRAGALAGTAAVVAAVAVAVPLLQPGGAPTSVTPAGSPTASATPAPPVPSATPAPPEQRATGTPAVPTGTSVMGWPYRGWNAAAEGATRLEINRLVATAAAKHWPGSEAPAVSYLWGAAATPDGELAVLAVGKVTAADGTHYLAAVWVKPAGAPGALVAVHDIGPQPGQVSAVIPAPGGGPGTVLVVGAPGTGAITYAAPGSPTFAPVQQQPGYQGSEQEGWAMFRRAAKVAPGQPVDRIKVYTAGDGALRYTGPIGRGITFPDI